MHEPVDESDHTGGIGEDLVPFGKGFVGCENERTAQLISASDDLEEQVCVAGVIGEISNFVNLRYA
jgi:hypothetical protein